MRARLRKEPIRHRRLTIHRRQANLIVKRRHPTRPRRRHNNRIIQNQSTIAQQRIQINTRHHRMPHLRIITPVRIRRKNTHRFHQQLAHKRPLNYMKKDDRHTMTRNPRETRQTPNSQTKLDNSNHNRHTKFRRPHNMILVISIRIRGRLTNRENRYQRRPNKRAINIRNRQCLSQAITPNTRHNRHILLRNKRLTNRTRRSPPYLNQTGKL